MFKNIQAIFKDNHSFLSVILPMNCLSFSANIASLFGLANEEKATHTHCFFRSILWDGHSKLWNGRSELLNARSKVSNAHFIAYRWHLLRAPDTNPSFVACILIPDARAVRPYIWCFHFFIVFLCLYNVNKT